MGAAIAKENKNIVYISFNFILYSCEQTWKFFKNRNLDLRAG